MDVRDLISSSRLETYENVLAIKSPEKQISAYYWNKAITASIFPAMQCLEITLRNAINEAVKRNPPPCVPSYSDVTTRHIMATDDWLEYFVAHVAQKRIKKFGSKNKKKWMVNGARTKKKFWEENKIIEAKDKLKKHCKPNSHNRVIAELMFGFWTNFLGEDFEDQSTQTLLWPNLTHVVFPNLPAGKTLDDVRLMFNRLRNFRNRFSHHEPVFKFYLELADGEPDYTKPIFGRSASLSILEKTYDDILSLIKWMSHERYSSFMDFGLTNQFYRLVSEDGFYSYVSPNRMSQVVSYHRSKREYRKVFRMIEDGKAFRIDKNGKDYFVFGPM